MHTLSRGWGLGLGVRGDEQTQFQLLLTFRTAAPVENVTSVFFFFFNFQLSASSVAIEGESRCVRCGILNLGAISGMWADLSDTRGSREARLSCVYLALDSGARTWNGILECQRPGVCVCVCILIAPAFAPFVSPPP